MDTREYGNIFKNEKTHFYYVSTHALVLQLLKYYAPKTRPLSILDAGCGTGFLGTKLLEFGNVEGIDVHPEAIRLARKRGITVRNASVSDLPFPGNTFDVITCIDVLYHKGVQNDTQALKEFYRVLKPAGILLLRVPANKWIRDVHDRHVHTRERYEKAELKEKLEGPGFTIQKLSFVHFSLYLPQIFLHIKESLFPSKKTSSGVYQIPTVINAMLAQILLWENQTFFHINLPLGIGLFAVAKKS